MRRRERERETGADTEPCAIKIQARNHSLPIVSFVLQTSLNSQRSNLSAGGAAVCRFSSINKEPFRSSVSMVVAHRA